MEALERISEIHEKLEILKNEISARPPEKKTRRLARALYNTGRGQYCPSSCLFESFDEAVERGGYRAENVIWPYVPDKDGFIQVTEE